MQKFLNYNFSICKKKSAFLILLFICLSTISCDAFFGVAGIDELRNLLAKDLNSITPNFPQKISLFDDATCLADFNESGPTTMRVICQGGIYGDEYKVVMELPEQAGDIKALSMTDSTVCVMWAESESDFYFQCSGKISIKKNTFFDGVTDAGRVPEKLLFYNNDSIIIDYVGYVIYYSDDEGAHKFSGVGNVTESIGVRNETFCYSDDINIHCGAFAFNSSNELIHQTEGTYVAPFSIDEMTLANNFACNIYTNTDPVEQKLLCLSFSGTSESTGELTYDSVDIAIKSSENSICVKFSDNDGFAIECANPQTDITNGGSFKMDEPIFKNLSEVFDYALTDDRVCLIENVNGNSAYRCENR